MTNNILTYFVRNITDVNELKFYEYKKIGNHIFIKYKNILIYHKFLTWSKNYISNIFKYINTTTIINCKIAKYSWYKILFNFYTKIDKFCSDKNIYEYYIKKYFIKLTNEYWVQNNLLLKTKYYFHKQKIYVYKIHYYHLKRTYKYRILVHNKYELHYKSKLFEIFFALIRRIRLINSANSAH